MTDLAPPYAEHFPRPRFVLVQPSESGNVGSVCRALANFGLSPADVVLVEPLCDFRDDKAISRAGQAFGWLEQLVVFSALEPAVAECQRVIGTTGMRTRLRQQAARPPRELLSEWFLPPGRDGRLALLFGTEKTGLAPAQLMRCDGLLTIPTAEVYPAMNLAMAVGVVAYEWRLAVTADVSPAPLPDAGPKDLPADSALVQRCYEQLVEAASVVGYFNPQNPEPLQMALRRLLGQAELSRQDAQLLLGLGRQVCWHAAQQS